MKKHLFFLIIIFTSCTARIDINTDDAEPRLVIYGTITCDSVRHYINISRSAGYFSDSDPEKISNAVVTISTENETFTLKELSAIDVRDNGDTIIYKWEGVYATDSVFAGKPHETYTLDVWLDFDNDGITEHYQAVSKMPRGPRVDSIYLSDYVIEQFPVLFLFGEIFQDTEINLCVYATNHFGILRQGLFDYFMIFTPDMIVMQGGIYPLPIFTGSNSIYIGDTIHFRVDNLSNDYARFLSQAKSEMSVPIPFFSSPPAEVTTNIRCMNANIKVSGFFAAYDRGEDMTTISTIHFDPHFE